MTRSGKRIISFSLWGNKPMYTVGAVENAKLAQHLYPDWICRFYVSDDVPSDILSQLSGFNNVEIVNVPEKGSWRGLFWRYYALDDDDVEIVSFRDTDSRLSKREKAAVEQWVTGDCAFHIMRDSPLHHAAMPGGMWGARAKIPGGLIPRLRQYFEGKNLSDPGYSSDQYFLGEIIYPLIAEKAIVHDEFFETKPFPTNRVNGEFVGEKFMADGSPDAEARGFVRDALARPASSVAKYYYRYGNRLKDLPDRYQEALICFRRAIDLDGELLGAYNNLGNLLQRLGRLAEAQKVYQAALHKDPGFAEAHANLGAVYLQQSRLSEAKRCMEKALSLKPDYLPARRNLAFLHECQGNMDAAITELGKLLEFQPDDTDALTKLATLASQSEQWETAYEAYTKLLGTKQDSVAIYSRWLNARLRLCDWSDYQQHIDKLIRLNLDSISAAGGETTSMMELNTLPVEPNLRLKVARHQARAIQARAGQMQIKHSSKTGRSEGVITIGYLSPDFRNHAVGRLIRALFAQHTRPQFCINAYSLVKTGDEIQQEIASGSDVFRDLSELDSHTAAQTIANDGVDILIDLAGYTTHARPDILAMRPAPVQCLFLGYPDTTGGEFIDYVLADKWLIPESLQTFYSEKIWYLPQAFVGSLTPDADSSPKKIEKKAGRNQVVFLCNVNNAHHKIAPDLFEIWMALLKQVENGVMWVSAGCEQMQKNLYAQCSHYSVASERLVFVPRLSWTQYLERLSQADLVLDTLLYNGGSSSIAAISAGTPVLTCAGMANASRMGASICAAASLESMITQSADAYLSRAVELATDAGQLTTIRASILPPKKLPLFDMARFAVNLESAMQNILDEKI